MIEACKWEGMECAPLSSIIITTTNHNSIRLKTIPTTCSLNMLLVTSNLGERRLHFPHNWRWFLWFIYIEILLFPCLITAHWKGSENLHVCCLHCNRNVYYYMKVLFSAQFTIYSSSIFNKKNTHNISTTHIKGVRKNGKISHHSSSRHPTRSSLCMKHPVPRKRTASHSIPISSRHQTPAAFKTFA